MSTEIPEASISTTVDVAALPQVRKPGKVPSGRRPSGSAALRA
jgi:hypothetical protein